MVRRSGRRRHEHVVLLRHGFSAKALARRLDRRAWRIIGIQPLSGWKWRRGGKRHRRRPVRRSGNFHRRRLKASRIFLISAPPADGRPGPARGATGAAGRAERSGGSVTSPRQGSMGDRNGEWVDESSPLTPTNDRSKWRVEAEHAWIDFGASAGVPVSIFRLAGIYGPAATSCGRCWRVRAAHRQAGTAVLTHSRRRHRGRSGGEHRSRRCAQMCSTFATMSRRRPRM